MGLKWRDYTVSRKSLGLRERNNDNMPLVIVVVIANDILSTEDQMLWNSKNGISTTLRDIAKSNSVINN